VVHEERTGKVTIIKSLGKRDHPEKISLYGNPSGNEVDAAIATVAASLRERSA
jgi:hypothetical protein